MKSNNKYFLGLGLVALIVTTLTVSGLASAADNFQTDQPNLERGKNLRQNLTEEQRAEMAAHKEAVKQALENNDYEAWKNLVAEKPNGGEKVLEKITEENFAKFVEMHNYLEAKDFENAKAVAEELGLDKFKRPGKFKHKKAWQAGYDEGLKACQMN